MAIDLSRSVDRKAVSRRVLKIPVENGGYTMGMTNIDIALDVYKEVDDANKRFSDNWLNIANCYAEERENLSGYIYTTWTEVNLISAATESAGNVFYPQGIPPPAVNTYLIPAINNYNSNYDRTNLSTFTVAGGTTIVAPAIAFATDGTYNGTFTVAALGGLYVGLDIDIFDGVATTLNCKIIDLDVLTSTVTVCSRIDVNESLYTRDFYGIADVLINGINVGPANTSLTAPYTGNQIVNLTAANVSANDCFIIISGVDAGMAPRNCIVYVKEGAGTTTLSVRFVAGNVGAGIVAAGSTVVCNSAGVIWADAVRNNFSGAAPYALTSAAIVTYLNTVALVDLAGIWATEILVLVSNDDIREPFKTQNATTMSDINTAEIALTAWSGFPDISPPGPPTRWNDAVLGPMMAALQTRYYQTLTRNEAILAACGDVIDGGDGTFSGSDGALYKKYQWLDHRINRQYGSARRYYNQIKVTNYVQTLLDNNIDLLAQYSAKMAVSAFAENADNTEIIEVIDSSDFNAGDIAYIVDESNPEIEVIIMGVNNNENKIYLNISIPSIYTTTEMARIYKLL